MKKRVFRPRWCFVLLSLAVMALIFVLSAQDATLSTKLSNRALDALQTSGLDKAVTPKLLSDAAYANVRKWAHVYLYALLGILLVQAVALWPLKNSRIAVISATIAFAYSCTDEFHQLFVPGRAGLVSDLFVDAWGYLPGILMSLLILILWRRRKRYKA